jgi:RHS repeat-associated protein
MDGDLMATAMPPAYDAASNRTSLTDAAGGTSSYSYDSLNRLTGLANSNSGDFGFGYDALGRRTSLTRPNGVGTSYSYDTLSRLLSILHAGGALPGSTGYTYDAAGNRTSKTALQEASPNPVSVTSNYSYDAIYELTQAVVGGTLAESYSYDVVGNRLTSINPATYSYNASNERTSTSAATYAYDNNGNTTSKTDSTGTTYYTWDYENRLTSVTLPGTGGTVNFKYDPFGRRIEKASSAGTTVYAYDGDNVIEELGGGGGNPLAHYTQGAGIDEPLAMTGTGGIYFYHADGLGSITSLTDGSGQLAASYVYDSFGKLTASTGTVTNPFQFTGREFDSETGLYYYRARYYDPVVGRFLSEDPIQFAGGFDFYAYAENDPTISVDPSGLFTVSRKGLTEHLVPDIDDICDDPIHLHRPAGACTLVQAILMCTCSCSGSGFKAKAELRLYGDMYIYNGQFPYKGRNPVDQGVHDAASARAHENNAHITPAIGAVTPMINKLESKTFASKDKCDRQCEKTARSVHGGFNLSLAETQREEGQQ